jgi:quinolinate synthase
MSNSQLPVGRVSAMDAKPYVQVAQAGTRQLGRLDLETSSLIAGNTDPHAARAKIPAIANPSSYDAVSRTAPLYERVRHVVPPHEWPVFAEDIDAIIGLKRQRNAIILAHNYQTPEIFHCVADLVGDSLALAREAARVEAETIVLAGVRFMAETAKLLNPEKTVLIPDLGAGCSLADSIAPADVRLLRERYPGVPVVAYVNTSAAVKAEADICCTSGNARAVVESLGMDRVIMLPDEYLARNVAAETNVKIIAWKGHCEVHERFTPAEISELREAYPGIVVLAHPECPPEVVAAADFAGSTAAMSDYVDSRKPARVVLLTECSMSDNIAARHSDIAFVRPCNLCPHMKRITLANIRRALETNQHIVTVDSAIATGARRAVERMLAL